jgi:hypothetical protein
MASDESFNIEKKHPRDILAYEAIIEAERLGVDTFLRKYGIYK